MKTTTDEEFQVQITTAGFSLGDESGASKHLFFSWEIAQQLDDIVFQKTNQHLPVDFFKAISGEQAIESRKANYYRLRKLLPEQTYRK